MCMYVCVRGAWYVFVVYVFAHVCLRVQTLSGKKKRQWSSTFLMLPLHSCDLTTACLHVFLPVQSS